MATELKPCPFCGGKADILIFEGERVYIECRRHCCEQAIIYPNKELAIEAWNRRAEDETEKTV